jgi:hypothetical protein
MSRQRLFSSNGYAKPKMLITLALLQFIPGGFLLAQSYRGSIRGHVVDPSGSVMAGAKVTAKSNTTGLTRETSHRQRRRLRPSGTGGGPVRGHGASSEP